MFYFLPDGNYRLVIKVASQVFSPGVTFFVSLLNFDTTATSAQKKYFEIKPKFVPT